MNRKRTTRRKTTSARSKTGPGRPKKLYTLSDINRLTGISMPTLQKYKKLHAHEIPSVGEGRKQRYPREAMAVFERLRNEGLARRGRRKSGTARKKAASRRRTRRDDGLLSLQQIRQQTGISYPTLLRYTKLHLDQIPHVGTGKKRRYPHDAVEVFRELRRRSTRGRKPANPSLLPRPATRADASLERRIGALERSNAALERQIRELARLVKKPITVTLKR